MPKRLKFVVEQWVLFMARRQTWQARRFEIFESARHFWIELGRPIRIRIKYRSFAGPYDVARTLGQDELHINDIVAVNTVYHNILRRLQALV